MKAIFEQFIADAIEIRRHLHQIPELKMARVEGPGLGGQASGAYRSESPKGASGKPFPLNLSYPSKRHLQRKFEKC